MKDTFIKSEPFRIKIDTKLIGGVSYKVCSLLDVQQFFDPNDEALKLGISSALWPIFGQLWPMSSVLAHEMLEEPLEERRILEVGCGLGLPSLVVQQLGGNVTASDYHPLAEQFLLENARLNSLPSIPFETGNWNKPYATSSSYDLIVGSDLLYQDSHAKLLAAFVDRKLAHKGILILVDPGRGAHRKFAKEMTRRGFVHSWTDLRSNTKNFASDKGFIFRFHKSS